MCGISNFSPTAGALEDRVRHPMIVGSGGPRKRLSWQLCKAILPEPLPNDTGERRHRTGFGTTSGSAHLDSLKPSDDVFVASQNQCRISVSCKTSVSAQMRLTR